MAGIPVALLGLIGFIGVAECLLLEEWRSTFTGLAPIMVLGLSLVGVLYSAYLTYLELFVIQAICPYCVASALLVSAIFGIAVYRSMFTQPNEA